MADILNLSAMPVQKSTNASTQPASQTCAVSATDKGEIVRLTVGQIGMLDCFETRLSIIRKGSEITIFRALIKKGIMIDQGKFKCPRFILTELGVKIQQEVLDQAHSKYSDQWGEKL